MNIKFQLYKSGADLIFLSLQLCWQEFVLVGQLSVLLLLLHQFSLVLSQGLLQSLMQQLQPHHVCLRPMLSATCIHIRHTCEVHIALTVAGGTQTQDCCPLSNSNSDLDVSSLEKHKVVAFANFQRTVFRKTNFRLIKKKMVLLILAYRHPYCNRINLF